MYRYKYIIWIDMPVINKTKIKEKRIEYKSESREHSSGFYNTGAWRRLRDTYLKLHPLCEICCEHEKVTPAEHVHHRIPFDRGETEQEKWELFLSEKNLMSLCPACHMALHLKDRQYGLGSLDSLTDIEYKYAHGLNY